MVPALEQIIKRGGALGVKDIVIGMPHRGRLNVLAAVMGKPYQVIFHEFQGGSSLPSDIEGSGDVKYHLGASSDRAFDGNSVHLSLTANPSHLEIVNPVVIGKARAKQAFTLRENPTAGRGHVLPLLMHGDAAFAGQGVVAECFALIGLKGYRTGGTIHFIVNNQIGFTTSPRYSRSSALSVRRGADGRGADLPRQRRRPRGRGLRRQGRHRVPPAVRQGRGHRHVLLPPVRPQRGRRSDDDPALDVREDQGPPDRRASSTPRGWSARACATQAEVDGWIAEFDAFLDEEFDAGKTYHADKADWLDGKWSGLALPDGEERAATPRVPKQKLRDLGLQAHHHPGADRRPQDRAPGDRRTAARPSRPARASTGPPAEHLAFATLLDQGYPGAPVRPGQRPRHLRPAPLPTSSTRPPRSTTRRSPTSGPARRTSRCSNSALSEEAVLGFEYGFSLADPNTLTLWEAQFGDFANGAQVVIDQFISSGERKWLRMCGLVMLLPHGYEGQGPEHSSARLERYLQLCAEDNLQVANCSTPANYFHILRRQMHRASSASR